LSMCKSYNLGWREYYIFRKCQEKGVFGCVIDGDRSLLDWIACSW
jgi:hypothetical protein